MQSLAVRSAKQGPSDAVMHSEQIRAALESCARDTHAEQARIICHLNRQDKPQRSVGAVTAAAQPSLEVLTAPILIFPWIMPASQKPGNRALWVATAQLGRAITMRCNRVVSCPLNGSTYRSRFPIPKKQGASSLEDISPFRAICLHLVLLLKETSNAE